jgi:hypothetical protein
MAAAYSGANISGDGYFLSLVPGRQHREYTPKKNQTPSWCDRVLLSKLPGDENFSSCVLLLLFITSCWNINDRFVIVATGSKINSIRYECCDEFVTSDHSPVFAIYSCEIPTIASNEKFVYRKIQITNIRGIRLMPPNVSVEARDEFCLLGSFNSLYIYFIAM